MRMPPTSEEFFAAMADMPPALTLQVSPPVALTIVAQLQLALRHPSNPPHAAALARRVIDAFRDQFPLALQCLCELGNDPAYDMPLPDPGGFDPIDLGC